MKLQRITMMRVLFVVMAVSLAGPVLAQHEGHDESVTVRGEILDLACYLAHEAKGSDHISCAKRCVKGGQPMGLLAEDGTVFLLYASHDDGSAYDAAKDFAGMQVSVTGMKAQQSGMTGIEVHEVKKISGDGK